MGRWACGMRRAASGTRSQIARVLIVSRLWLGTHYREIAMRKQTMRRHGAKNADYRGGLTCLYDTQLLGACLHASECGGRSRRQAVRGMPEIPIAPPNHGTAPVGFVSPASFNRGFK